MALAGSQKLRTQDPALVRKYIERRTEPQEREGRNRDGNRDGNGNGNGDKDGDRDENSDRDENRDESGAERKPRNLRSVRKGGAEDAREGGDASG